MSRLACALVLFVVLATAAGRSGETERNIESPTYYTWNKLKEDRTKDIFYREWFDRISSLEQGPEAARKARRVQWSESLFFWNRSLFAFDGKLVFTQPDGTLTLIELETGKVIGRTRQYFPAWSGNHRVREIHDGGWKQNGKVVVGNRYLIDGETGEIIDESRSEMTIIPPNKIVYGSYGSGEKLKTELAFLDYSTKEKTVVMEDGSKEFIVVGQLIFSLSETDLSPSRLVCFSLSDGRELWSAPLDGDLYYEILAGKDDVVYVFAKTYKGDQCTGIMKFDPQGRLSGAIPSALEFPGGEIAGSAFRITPVGFTRGKRASRPHPSIWDFVAAYAGVHHSVVFPQAACFLPDGGFAWIECKLPDAVPVLKYRDNTRSWSGTIRTTDEIMALEATKGFRRAFDIAGDDRHIAYLSDSGRLECLDRFTGQSRWIYVFPVLYFDDSFERRLPEAGRFTSYTLSITRRYFTERAEDCDRELDTQDIHPFLVEGKGDLEQPSIIIDPSPDQRHKEGALLCALAVWGISLTLLAALAAIWWKSGVQKINASIVVVIVAAITHYILGGYSWYTSSLLRIDFWIGIVLLLFAVIRQWRSGSLETI